MDIKFNIKAMGVTYACILTMGALYDFKKHTGKDVSEAADDDVLDVIYFCAKSAAEQEGLKLPFNVYNFGHFLSIEEGSEAISAYAAAVQDAAKKKTQEQATATE